jgi:hypothetical protein
VRQKRAAEVPPFFVAFDELNKYARELMNREERIYYLDWTKNHCVPSPCAFSQLLHPHLTQRALSNMRRPLPSWMRSCVVMDHTSALSGIRGKSPDPKRDFLINPGDMALN